MERLAAVRAGGLGGEQALSDAVEQVVDVVHVVAAVDVGGSLGKLRLHDLVGRHGVGDAAVALLERRQRRDDTVEEVVHGHLVVSRRAGRGAAKLGVVHLASGDHGQSPSS